MFRNYSCFSLLRQNPSRMRLRPRFFCDVSQSQQKTRVLIKSLAVFVAQRRQIIVFEIHLYTVITELDSRWGNGSVNYPPQQKAHQMHSGPGGCGGGWMNAFISLFVYSIICLVLSLVCWEYRCWRGDNRSFVCVWTRKTKLMMRLSPIVGGRGREGFAQSLGKNACFVVLDGRRGCGGGFIQSSWNSASLGYCVWVSKTKAINRHF